jgi:hypothetical protein
MHYHMFRTGLLISSLMLPVGLVAQDSYPNMMEPIPQKSILEQPERYVKNLYCEFENSDFSVQYRNYRRFENEMVLSPEESCQLIQRIMEHTE